MADFNYEEWSRQDQEDGRRRFNAREQDKLMGSSGGYLTSPSGGIGSRLIGGLIGVVIWMYLLQIITAKIGGFIQSSFSDPHSLAFMFKWMQLSSVGFMTISGLIVFVFCILFKSDNLVRRFLITSGILIAVAVVTGIVTLLITIFT